MSTYHGEDGPAARSAPAHCTLMTDLVALLQEACWHEAQWDRITALRCYPASEGNTSVRRHEQPVTNPYYIPPPSHHDDDEVPSVCNTFLRVGRSRARYTLPPPHSGGLGAFKRAWLGPTVGPGNATATLDEMAGHAGAGAATGAGAGAGAAGSEALPPPPLPGALLGHMRVPPGGMHILGHIVATAARCSAPPADQPATRGSNERRPAPRASPLWAHLAWALLSTGDDSPDGHAAFDLVATGLYGWQLGQAHHGSHVTGTPTADLLHDLVQTVFRAACAFEAASTAAAAPAAAPSGLPGVGGDGVVPLQILPGLLPTPTAALKALLRLATSLDGTLARAGMGIARAVDRVPLPELREAVGLPAALPSASASPSSPPAAALKMQVRVAWRGGFRSLGTRRAAAIRCVCVCVCVCMIASI